MVDSAIAGISYFLTNGFIENSISYGAWVILTIKVMGIVAVISIAVNLLAYRAQIKSMIGLLRKG